MARSCRPLASAVARRTPCGQRPVEGNAFGGLRPSASKIKDKKKAGAPRVFSLLFDCLLDKVGKPTERNRPEARGRWRDSLAKPERYGIMGT